MHTLTQYLEQSLIWKWFSHKGLSDLGYSGRTFFYSHIGKKKKKHRILVPVSQQRRDLSFVIIFFMTLIVVWTLFYPTVNMWALICSVLLSYLPPLTLPHSFSKDGRAVPSFQKSRGAMASPAPPSVLPLFTLIVGTAARCNYYDTQNLTTYIGMWNVGLWIVINFQIGRIRFL